jgi:cytochrome c556
MWMNRLPLSTALLVIGLIFGAQADESPAAAADYLIALRQTGMAIQSSVVAAILQAIGTNADIVPFAATGDAMAEWSQGLPDQFPPGTESGQNTQARPAVWSDRAGFEKAAANLTVAAQAMAKAATAGNQSEFIKAFRATSLACATCHVTYRSGRN